METNSGWIAIHRKLLDNPIANKSDYMNLWIHLLLMANHKETTFIWNNQKQTLKPGQLLTGRKKLSRTTGIAEGQVYKILKYLETEQQIEQQTTTKFTVITIVNWSAYQKKEQQKEQQGNNRVTTKEQQSNTYNNDNNGNNVDNDKNSSKDEDNTSYGNKDINALREVLKKNYPKALRGITESRKLYNLKQVLTKRKNQDEWMDEDWRKNFRTFLALYLGNTEEKYLVESVDNLKERAKLWREYRGKLN